MGAHRPLHHRSVHGRRRRACVAEGPVPEHLCDCGEERRDHRRYSRDNTMSSVRHFTAWQASTQSKPDAHGTPHGKPLCAKSTGGVVGKRVREGRGLVSRWPAGNALGCGAATGWL